MAKLRKTPFAVTFSDIKIGRATERGYQLIQNLFALGGALLRHHVVRVLRLQTLRRQRR